MSRTIENGINPLQEDPVVFKKNTRKTLVVKTNHAPEDYHEDNPNPTGTFLGTNGKWHKFVVGPYVGNCYSFALGIIYNAKDSGYYIPGFLVERYPMTSDEIIPLICKDLQVLGREVHEIIMRPEIPEQLPEAAPGTYWIKIFLDIDTDFLDGFHVARFDDISGRWIHVLGWKNPPKVFMRNLEFLDPIREVMDKGIIPVPANIPREQYEEYLRSLAPAFTHFFTPGIIKSEYEDKDDAPYFAYDPETDPNNFRVYEPYAVMRIDF